MRRTLRALGSVTAFFGCVLTAFGALGLASPSAPAAAANGYGPGVGPQSPTSHWGGAYVLEGVPGYGYCIQPGDADPVELPTTQWSAVPYPGSSVYTDGQMAALGYFAQQYQGTGFDGYSVDDTVAAIAQVAYASAGGVTPSTSQAPASLVADLEAWIVTFAGPWTISISMTPPSGSTFTTGTNYQGTITVTSATGAGVGGLQLNGPATGGPTAGQVSNFVWLQPTTNDAGQIGFKWNIDGVPPATGGRFVAQHISVVGGAPGTAPLAYAPTPGSGGQTMLVSGATETLATRFTGVAEQVVTGFGTISVEKIVSDAAYYGPGGAEFQVVGTNGILDTLTTDATGDAGPSAALPATSLGTKYVVRETVAPPGYGLAPYRTVVVYPNANTVARFGGTYEEPVLAAQLGAAKTDAQTGRPLAGATFDFRFDSADNGVYDQDLGSCTTTAGGSCQPPTENAPGGWLPGWYQVTETTAPPGYWLDPAGASRDVFLQPGATDVATVTFADQLLGSLTLEKSGNDTAYLPVTGAAFSVTGPSPSTAPAGTLTVRADGTTNTLTGLVPGAYTITETTVPVGYRAVAPFTADVTAGHATTRVSVTDPVQPGSIVITKTDAATGDPLAGATFDTRYDSQDSGAYHVDLGPCTTKASGRCSPPPNDGTGFLPGRYLVTETAAPPGYYLPTPPPTRSFTVKPSATATASFTDDLLVPATFVKSATGNVNPDQVELAGAVIDVTAGATYGGPVIAACTTDASARCATAPVLVSGGHYCWKETKAPPGLSAGASGCFTATNAQGAQPIGVVDRGAFVAVAVRKVDASNPSTALPGATFDLYRVDGGKGPGAPTPPQGAAVEPGQTWVARATTGPGGTATYPLQFPGYAYCVAEEAAPANYVANRAEHCTGVLTGKVTTPAAVVTVTVPDAEAQVTLSARKFNSAAPDTAIPGATYDLYVEGVPPPSGPPSAPPPGAPNEPGDTWWARGTTSASGILEFTVPAGHAWCLKEVTAPVDYLPDPGLHCTGVVTRSTPPPDLTVALPETLAMVEIYTRKFNAADPNRTIPGATYELVGQGPVPPGWTSSPNPSGDPVPAGDWFAGTATTGAGGVASWSVPAGASWCLHEVKAPPDYKVDSGWHCTTVITNLTPRPKETVALPELPVSPPSLPFTGGPPPWQVLAGLAMVALGALLLRAGRRRDRPRRRPVRPAGEVTLDAGGSGGSGGTDWSGGTDAGAGTSRTPP